MKKLQRQLIFINFAAVFIALTLSGGTSMWVLRLTTEEKSVGALLCGGLLAIGFIVQFMVIRPLLPELEWRSGVDAIRAMKAMRLFPVRAAKFSWFLWAVMDLLGAAFFYVYFGEWHIGDPALFVCMVLSLSIMIGGGISFLLQFYFFKRALAPELAEAAIVAAPHLSLNAPIDVPAYGLRNKLIVSSLTMLAGALLFSVVFGFTRIAEGMQERLAGRGKDVMQRLLPEVENLVAAEEFEELAARLKGTQLGAGGQLLLLGTKAENKLGVNPANIPLGQLLTAGEANWRSNFVVSRTSVQQGKYVLVAVFPWSIAQGDIAGAGHAFLLLFVFVSLTTVLVGSFSALEIAQPVKEIVYRAERIAKGDLSEPFEILSEDEVGEFSADLEQIRRFLLSVLGDVDVASRQVEGLSSRVLSAAQSVARSSADQSSRVNAGRQAVERMAAGFDRISKGSLELTTHAGEGGSAIYQLDATVREVDGSTDVMVGRVIDIRDGIEKIHRVSELIFANLGDLSRSMESTVRNIRKFSDSIRRNEERVGSARAVSTRMLESSREGLDLTGQTLGSIEAIEQSVSGISNTLNELIEKLNDVGKLIGVIDEVADDTKLLSLNAAIIAAQAGTNGRGFSVLAEKIKTLADRTNIATGQIITMIEQVGDSSHQLAHGMERVRTSVHSTRLVASESGDQLGGIIACAQAGFEGMAVVANTSGKHVDESQLVERAVVGLANSVEQIHANVRAQRARAVEVGTAMERVEVGVRTLKAASRAQSEGGRVLSASIEQVVTMVSHLKKILLEQQSEVHRINEAIRAIQEGAVANQIISKHLNAEVEALRGEAETFNRFLERFKLA